MSSLNKIVHLALAAALAVTGVAISAEANMYKGYETPPYTVEMTDGPIEVRSYAPHILAEVTVEGSRRGAVGRGFRVLAGYIFGDNAGEEKVAMTAPVTQMPAEAGPNPGTWQVQFMMPRDYELTNLPTPENAAIRFRTTEAERQVVIGFSGWWSDAALEQKAEDLRAYADVQGLTVTGQPRYYFYDDPFTLPFRRRNEVAFVLQ